MLRHLAYRLKTGLEKIPNYRTSVTGYDLLWVQLTCRLVATVPPIVFLAETSSPSTASASSAITSG